MEYGYIGTYAKNGIYQFAWNSKLGTFASLQRIKELNSTKYLAYSNNLLAALYDGLAASGVMLMDAQGNTLNEIEYEKATSCFIALKDQSIYTANYHTGWITHLIWDKSSLRKQNELFIQSLAGCHQILFYEDLILVPCLFLDKILILNQNLEQVNEIAFPQGSGPRHGIIYHHRFYVLSELSNELFTFQINDQQFIEIARTSLLPNQETHKNGGAAIRMNQNGTRLYLSTRGLNLITVVDISGDLPKIIQYFPLQGDHPRDIELSLDDRFLLVANRFSNQVVSYRLEDGIIAEEIDFLHVPEPVSLIWKKD